MNTINGMIYEIASVQTVAAVNLAASMGSAAGVYVLLAKYVDPRARWLSQRDRAILWGVRSMLAVMVATYCGNVWDAIALSQWSVPTETLLNLMVCCSSWAAVIVAPSITRRLDGCGVKQEPQQ